MGFGNLFVPSARAAMRSAAVRYFSISPLLMEKYLTAAERIAARALGTNKLPKPMEFGYSGKTSLSGSPPGIGGSQTAGTWRRLDAGTIEVVHHFDFDGEYTVRIGLPGQRGADAKPVP